MSNRVFYYDVLKNDIYDVQGNLIGNNNISVYLDNKDNIELHYITDSSDPDPTLWTKWTALEGLPTISSSVAVDNNVKHAIKGITNATITSATTTIQAIVIETTIINPTGNLQVIDNTGTKYTFPYTSRNMISDTVYEFTITNSLTTENIPPGATVRIPEALLMKAEGSDIDDSDASDGVFVFKLYALSYKILDMLDYSDENTLTARLQHKIMSEGNTLYTFEFTYEIKNLIDFGNEASVPSIETDTYATKAYTLSVASLPLEYEYSVNGNDNWHSDLNIYIDIYYHTRPLGSGGAWSASQLIPYGASGSPGIGLTGISFIYASGAPASEIGNDGDTYLNGTTFDLYNKNLNIWTEVGNIKGIQGDSSTLEIGTVTTLAAGQPATVENVGTETDAIFNIGIPQGIKGDTGYISEVLPYEIGNNYLELSFVSSEGSSYQAIQDVPSGITPSENPDYWRIIAAKGTDGAGVLSDVDMFFINKIM